ncbi:putative Metallothionein, family 15, plant [Helianthus debilis subsp. tardiflorus]
MSSSCCGGNCGCGSGCKCGNGCGGCKMYPEMLSSESTTAETLILGVAPTKTGIETTGDVAAAAENQGCKCNPCTCNPCTCK